MLLKQGSTPFVPGDFFQSLPKPKPKEFQITSQKQWETLFGVPPKKKAKT